MKYALLKCLFGAFLPFIILTTNVLGILWLGDVEIVNDAIENGWGAPLIFFTEMTVFFLFPMLFLLPDTNVFAHAGWYVPTLIVVTFLMPSVLVHDYSLNGYLSGEDYTIAGVMGIFVAYTMFLSTRAAFFAYANHESKEVVNFVGQAVLDRPKAIKKQRPGIAIVIIIVMMFVIASLS